MESTTMTSKGQVAIPKAVRQQLGLRQGTKVTFVVEGDHAVCSTRAQFAGALEHLLASPHVEVEDRLSVRAALLGHRNGLDFADALHHASYRTCDAMAGFDDRKFARRADKLGSVPAIVVQR